MKVADLQPGDHVIYGRQKDLVDGKGGSSAYVIAVGMYTTTYGNCGRVIQPYRGKYDRQPKIVVALENKRYGGDGYEMVWEPQIVSIRCLMDPAVYRVKQGAVRKQEAARRRHRQEREKIVRAATREVEQRLGLPEGAVYIVKDWEGNRYFNKFRVNIEVKGVDKMLGGQQERKQILEPLAAFDAKPGPDECKL